MKVVFKIIYLWYTTYRQKRIHETVLPLGNFRTPKRKSLLSNFLYFLYSWKGTVRAVLFYCIRESACRNTALPFFLKRKTRLTGHFISIHYDNGFHPLYCFASAFRSRIPNHENKHLMKNLVQDGHVKSPRWSYFLPRAFHFWFYFSMLTNL